MTAENPHSKLPNSETTMHPAIVTKAKGSSMTQERHKKRRDVFDITSNNSSVAPKLIPVLGGKYWFVVADPRHLVGGHYCVMTQLYKPALKPKDDGQMCRTDHSTPAQPCLLDQRHGWATEGSGSDEEIDQCPRFSPVVILSLLAVRLAYFAPCESSKCSNPKDNIISIHGVTKRLSPIFSLQVA